MKTGPARPLADLLAGLVAAGLIVGVGVWLYARLVEGSAAARRAAELEQRLAAARRLIARDLRQDGYGLEGFAAPALPALPPGAIGFLAAEEGAPAAGDWVIAGDAEKSCLGRVEDVSPLRTRPSCAGARVAKIVLHRYRVAAGALALSDGPDGPWRALAFGVDEILLEPLPPPAEDARGRLYALSLRGSLTDERGGRITRTIGGEVLARNQVVRP